MIRDNFRVYESMAEGVKGYFEFIQTSRYANLKTAKNSKNYLELIKADGYATSSTYVKNVYAVVEKYNLTQYDSDTPVKAEVDIEAIARDVISGKYGNGKERKEKNKWINGINNIAGLCFFKEERSDICSAKA